MKEDTLPLQLEELDTVLKLFLLKEIEFEWLLYLSYIGPVKLSSDS